MKIRTRKSFKYRICPTKAQITNLENQFSMCRHLYNWSLYERKNTYEKTGAFVTYYAQANQLPALKKERPWYRSVYSQVLQDVLKRLDKAYQNFFRGVKQGESIGFPKYKKRGQWNSITYPQYCVFPTDRIHVPKVGPIKAVYHRPIPHDADIKTMTITKEEGKWFACFSIELSLDVEPKQGLQNSIGIDLDGGGFVCASNGTLISAPKHLMQSQEKLSRLQRRISRVKRTSAEYNKLLRAIRKRRYKIRCQRNDFMHKAANHLLRHVDNIYYEKFNLQEVSHGPKANRDKNAPVMLSQAVINRSLWCKFLLYLKYKAAEQGKHLIAVSAKQINQRPVDGDDPAKGPYAVHGHQCQSEFITPGSHSGAIHILRVGLDTSAASAT